MLVHNVRRVPPGDGLKFPPHIEAAPLIFKRLGSVGSRHRCFGNERRGRSHRGEFNRASNRTQVPLGVKGRPLAQMLRVGQRLPNFFRRVAQFTDEDKRPLLTVFCICAPVAGPGVYCARSITLYSLA